MNIKQEKAPRNQMNTISINNKPFIPLIKVKRTDALRANSIRVILAKRRSNRIQYFLQSYAEKITIVN